MLFSITVYSHTQYRVIHEVQSILTQIACVYTAQLGQLNPLDAMVRISYMQGSQGPSQIWLMKLPRLIIMQVLTN